ncbi:hypothetical protein CAP48_01720 [Advenella sp. S44]|uniref:hypothetical protein n=1 Tax=Advenella sp. S44 TaxID=1982755 RepID=UPI000C2A7507|nr:hypothetical protein [Advenella sp. S44]PJX27928.1 hypothetical protein CAP48_01720 [Advenella sp. S44]
MLKIRPLPMRLLRYHTGHWYWIDQDDVDTIELISFVMLLLNVADTTNSTQLPIITIASS